MDWDDSARNRNATTIRTQSLISGERPSAAGADVEPQEIEGLAASTRWVVASRGDFDQLEAVGVSGSDASQQEALGVS